MWAIIGGSGFENFDGFETVEELSTETPFGRASSGLRKVNLDGQECLFVSRHGSQHELLPSEVNYRANVFALKRAGASGIISISAVGSLRKEIAPGDMVIPSQYIDRTKGIRKHSFLGEGLVGHVSLAEPVSSNIMKKAFELTEGLESFGDNKVHYDKTYVCIEGPYFSTRAESLMYRQWGADIIGMTNFPEHALAREAGMEYLPCSFITDFDCFDPAIPHVTLDEVIQVMKTNNGKAFAVVKVLLKNEKTLLDGSQAFDQGLSSGLMTPKAAWPNSTKDWLPVLLEH